MGWRGSEGQGLRIKELLRAKRRSERQDCSRQRAEPMGGPRARWAQHFGGPEKSSEWLWNAEKVTLKEEGEVGMGHVTHDIGGHGQDFRLWNLNQ